MPKLFDNRKYYILNSILMEYKEDSIAPQIEKRFEKMEKIGSGAYGYVWKVK